MEKDEKFILSNYGKENHFKVPEGYFEAFDEKLLHNLPHIDMQPGNAKVERPLAKVVAMPHRSNRIVALRRTIISAAAGVCVAILTLQGLLKQGGEHHANHYVSTEMVNSDVSLSANMDALFDYTMTDADDMYAYMSNAR